MKTIETINTLCKEDAALYRAKRDYLLSNIKTLDSIVRDAIDNGGKVRDAVKEFVKQVGSDAAVQTVASLVNRSAWDGRISTANANWAKAIDEAWDEDAMVRMGAYCKMHMAHLDQTADYLRRDLDTICAELVDELVAENAAELERVKAEQTDATIPEADLDEAVAEEVQKELDAERKAKQEAEQDEAMPIWSTVEHNRKEQRGEYDYHQAILEDVIEYIRDEVDAGEYEDRDALEEALNDELWTVDSVTGNGSGSYTFSRDKAREYVTGNLDLVQEMASDFCVDHAELGKHFVEDDWEWFDVSIRCNLLGWAIGYALDWLESDDRRQPLRYGVGVAVAF